MSTTEEPSAVDSKKEESNSTTSSSKSSANYIGFFTSLGKSLLNITKIVALGAVGLYICKISQANLLPDNLEQKPFGPDSRIPEAIKISMNVVKEYPFHGLKFWSDIDSDKITSQKAIFNSKEFLNSYNDGLFGSLKKKASSSNIMLYYSSVFNDCISWNNWLINYLFIFMNTYLPEWTIITLLGYFFFVAFLPILMLLNYFVSILTHVMNLNQMFRTKGSQFSGLLSWFIGKTNSQANWQPEDDIKYFGFGTFSKWFFFFLWAYPIFLIATIVMPIVVTFYTIFSPLFATYKLEGDNKSEPNTFLDFLKSVFMSHKVLIKIFVTVAIVAAIGTNLQSIYAPALGATIVGILFSALALNFYQSPIDTTDKTQTPGVESYKQAPIIKGVELMGHKTKQMLNKGKQFASNVTSTAKNLLNSDELKPFTGAFKGMTQNVKDKANNMSSKFNDFGNKFANKTNAFNTAMNKSF